MPNRPLLLSLLLRRAAVRRQPAYARHAQHLAWSGGLFFGLSLALSLLALGLAWIFLTQDLPPPETLPLLLEPPNGQLLQPSRIVDRNGTPLQEISPLPGPRRYLRLEEVPPLLIQGLLLTQDASFWHHSGFSLSRLNHPEEHPTLAQALVAELLLFREPPGSRRALRERLLAAQITHRFGRERILEWYLNSADFGQNALGLSAAAALYFGKEVAALTPAEALLLATIPQNPQRNPHTQPQETQQAAQRLLEALLRQGTLSREEASSLHQALASLTFAPPPPRTEITQGAAPLRLALAQMGEVLPAGRWRKGGLTLYTTLDSVLQQEASCLLQLFSERISRGREATRCAEAASLPTLPPTAHVNLPILSALILNAQSGEILAGVGETLQGRESAFWNAHPAGSILDPFVYLTAFSRGWSPASLIWDLPPEGEAEALAVDEPYRGPMRLRRAMANGFLRPAQSLRQELGNAAVEQTLRLLGLNSERVTLPEIATAYATLATLGRTPQPVAVHRLESLDHALWFVSPRAPQDTLDASIAYLANQVLSDTVARAETWGNPALTENRPLALASGVAAEGKEVWLVMYTPQRVVVLWMGSQSGETLSPQWLGGLGKALLELASRSLPPQDWERPAGVSVVEVCDPSGLLPTTICPRRVNEFFISGNEPHEWDTLYQLYRVNRETGLLATAFTPPALIEERIYLQLPPQARRWAEGQGLPVPPQAYDPIQIPPPNPWVHISQPAAFESVSGHVTIQGTAAGEGFRSYRLLVGKGLDPQEWFLIASGESPRQEEPLGEWDTQGASGIYILQLQVLRADNMLEVALQPVTVSSSP